MSSLSNKCRDRLLRYGSEELLDYVERTGDNPMKSGRKRVTVLFFDIAGSTKIAEKLPPETFTTFLSDIFIDIMDLIYGNHGSVNKLLGDGLMATFGAPLKTNFNELNAVNAAKQIEEYLKTYNDVRPDFITNELQAGIGIATGQVFAGVIGSIRWEEYTVLGDTVNIAAKLEKLTRKISSSIFIDEETYLKVRKTYPALAVYKSHIRGRTDKIKVFSI